MSNEVQKPSRPDLSRYIPAGAIARGEESGLHVKRALGWHGDMVGSDIRLYGKEGEVSVIKNPSIVLFTDGSADFIEKLDLHDSIVLPAAPGVSFERSHKSIVGSTETGHMRIHTLRNDEVGEPLDVTTGTLVRDLSHSTVNADGERFTVEDILKKAEKPVVEHKPFVRDEEPAVKVQSIAAGRTGKDIQARHLTPDTLAAMTAAAGGGELTLSPGGPAHIKLQDAEIDISTTGTSAGKKDGGLKIKVTGQDETRVFTFPQPQITIYEGSVNITSDSQFGTAIVENPKKDFGYKKIVETTIVTDSTRLWLEGGKFFDGSETNTKKITHQ